MSIRLVPLEANHLDQAVGLSESAGWPHRERDWQLLMSLGEGLALIEDDRLVATAMHWSFDPGLATLGMVIVSPMHKRRGLGRRLMDTVLAEITASRIELHATVEGADLYRSLGFRDTAWMHQCQGRVAHSSVGCPASPLPPGALLRGFRARDEGALVALDAQAVGSPRHALLSELLEQGGALVVEREDGRLAGVALCREFGHGHVVGPVVADSLDVARCLVAAWLPRLAGRFVRVDTPEPALAAWLTEHGLQEVDCVRQMTTASLPPVGPVMRYALASQALG